MTDLITILLASLAYAAEAAKTSAEMASHQCRLIEQEHAAATADADDDPYVSQVPVMNARAAAAAASRAYTAAESAYAAAQEVAACHTEAAPAALARLLAKRR